MKITSKNLSMKILCMLCACSLFIALLDWPIAYYTLLRALVFTGALLVIFLLKPKPFLWILIFAAIAIMFNPIAPIYLYRKAHWLPIDIISGVLFLVIPFIKQDVKPFKQTIKSPKAYSRDKIY